MRICEQMTRENQDKKQVFRQIVYCSFFCRTKTVAAAQAEAEKIKVS